MSKAITLVDRLEFKPLNNATERFIILTTKESFLHSKKGNQRSTIHSICFGDTVDAITRDEYFRDKSVVIKYVDNEGSVCHVAHPMKFEYTDNDSILHCSLTFDDKRNYTSSRLKYVIIYITESTDINGDHAMYTSPSIWIRSATRARLYKDGVITKKHDSVTSNRFKPYKPVNENGTQKNSTSPTPPTINYTKVSSPKQAEASCMYTRPDYDMSLALAPKTQHITMGPTHHPLCPPYSYFPTPPPVMFGVPNYSPYPPMYNQFLTKNFNAATEIKTHPQTTMADEQETTVNKLETTAKYMTLPPKKRPVETKNYEIHDGQMVFKIGIDTGEIDPDEFITLLKCAMDCVVNKSKLFEDLAGEIDSVVSLLSDIPDSVLRLVGHLPDGVESAHVTELNEIVKNIYHHRLMMRVINMSAKPKKIPDVVFESIQKLVKSLP